MRIVWLCSWLSNELDVAMIGPKVDLTFEHENLGDSMDIIRQLEEGKHPFCQVRILFIGVNAP